MRLNSQSYTRDDDALLGYSPVSFAPLLFPRGPVNK